MIHNANIHRFRYLLLFGLTGSELKEFLKSNRQVLRNFGAKLDNVPTDSDAARRIIEGFSDRAHSVFGKWIDEHIVPKHVFPIEELIRRFRGAEEIGIEYTTDENTELGRNGLRELYAATPNEIWLEYIRTPLTTRSGNEVAVRDDDWIELADRLLGIDATPAGVTSWAGNVVALVKATKAHDAAALSSDGLFGDAIDLIRNKIEQSRPIIATPQIKVKGIQAQGPIVKEFDSDCDYTEYTIIATNRTPHEATAYQLTIEAFVDDAGDVFSLSQSEIKQAIPTIGKIILHMDKVERTPEYGEPHAYAVERFTSRHPVQVRVTKYVNELLIPVITMPYATTDAHRIRDYITDYAKTRIGTVPVFVTSDKQCVRPRASAITKIIAPDFLWQLDMWDTLSAIEFGNAPYIMKGHLPGAQRLLNCAPLSVSASRLLKIFADRSSIKLSKEQKHQLVEILGVDDSQFEEGTKHRLVANLEAISRGSNDYDELINALLQTSKIKEDVSVRVNDAVHLQLLERDTAKNEITQLKIEKTKLEGRLKELRAEKETKTTEIRTAIAKAFQNARERGLETLADVALFDAILARSSIVPTVPVPTEKSHGSSEGLEAPKCLLETRPGSGRTIGDVLRKFGLSEDTCERSDRALTLALRGGATLLISGTGTTIVGMALAEAIASKACLVATVPIGLTTDQALEKAITDSSCDALLLKQSNVSDMSLYARGIIDENVRRSMMHHSQRPYPIVCIDAGGMASLPWPDDLMQTSVTINLDILSRVLNNSDATTAEIGWLRRRQLTHFDRLVQEESLEATSLDDLRRLMTLGG